MDERELDRGAAELHERLATLDRLAIPSLAAVRAGGTAGRRRGVRSIWTRAAALATTVVVVAVAVALGTRLGAWRAERAGGEPSPAATSGTALDDTYGFLVATDDTARRLMLVDEHGRALGPTFSDVAAVKTSPNGRYVALWLEPSTGPELRVLDGVTRTVGPPLIQGGTAYVLAGPASFAWASDSSGLVVATRFKPQSPQDQVTRALIWLAERGNVARQIATFDGADVRPLLWQRPAGLIALTATRTFTDNSPHYAQVREDGALLRDDAVATTPFAVDEGGRYVASNDICQPAPCTRFVVRSVTTYAELTSFLAPAGTNVSWLGFLPRSSDVLVQFARYTPDRRIVGTLTLYADQGRGARRELASVDMDSDSGSASPWVMVRADGSAVFYGLALRDGTVKGELVAVPSGTRSDMRIQRPLAAVVVDPSREVPAAAAAVRPSATPSASPRVLTEAQAWSLIRSSLPLAAPIAPPTWLPPTIDRDHVEVTLVSDPADPRFTVTYRAPTGTIVHQLGPAIDVVGSGYGTRVRGVPAALTFDGSLWNDRTKPALRRIRWEERRPGLSVAGTTLSISSETFTGDDLLHIAWSLDPAGSALATVPRPAPRSCAAPDPVETVRTLLSLAGSRNGDAVSDCFADGTRGWETLPSATIRDIRQIETVGGRPTIAASWSFASDPGGAWGPQPSRFFQVGLSDGVWRIYEIASAPMGSPP